MPYCTAIPALNDNYIWTLRQDQQAKTAYVIDPGEAEPVLSWLTETGTTLAGILITHHHRDHVGGADDLHKKFSIPVYGPKTIDCVTHPVSEQENLQLAALNFELQILAIPGHTLEHIAYYGDNCLFCGDTLFAAGCGRIFEGTAEQMLDSLCKLKTKTTDNTQVFCAHEYTMANLRFAQAVLPEDPKIQQRIIDTQQKLLETGCSLPSTMALEKLTNVFLRCDQAAIQHSVANHCQSDCQTELQTFTALRQWKDHF